MRKSDLQGGRYESRFDLRILVIPVIVLVAVAFLALFIFLNPIQKGTDPVKEFDELSGKMSQFDSGERIDDDDMKDIYKGLEMMK